MSLDRRLQSALNLYDSCPLAADIGTDHAHLPVALLRSGKCQRMILTDISPRSVARAESEIARFHLSDRVEIRLGDGLTPLGDHSCAMISVLGMGGRTIHNILTGGKEYLSGASLLLSAHSDIPAVREAVLSVGYHLESETPVYSAGRYYLMLLARPGAAPMTPLEIETGCRLLSSTSPDLKGYLRHQLSVWQSRMSGLQFEKNADPSLLADAEEKIRFYQNTLEGGIFHDSTANL